MGLFNRKSFIDKLDVNPNLRAQAKARYERHRANKVPDAERRVTAWAIAEQRKLDSAKKKDPWALTG